MLTDDEAEHLFKNVLLKLTLASEVAALRPTHMRATGKRREGSAPVVTSSSDTDVDRLRARWDAAATSQERRRVLEAALVAVRRIYWSPAPPTAFEERNTPAWNERIARDPRPTRVVAEDYGVSAMHVSRMRKKFGGDAQAA